MLKRCPNGHGLAMDSQKFCTECGHRLEPAKKCRQGHELAERDKFCGECGEPAGLRVTATSAPGGITYAG